MAEGLDEKMKTLVNLYKWNEENAYEKNYNTDIYYSDGQI